MTSEQLHYLARHLKGGAVDDIGCGVSRLNPIRETLDYLGVDKEYIDAPNTIQFCLDKPCPHLRYDVAFVSWPVNWRSIAWHLFLPKYKEVVYLGANHSSSCCGDEALWQFLGNREVLEVIPDQMETLIHYGNKARAAGTPVPQEEAWGKSVWAGAPPATYNPKKYNP